MTNKSGCSTGVARIPVKSGGSGNMTQNGVVNGCSRIEIMKNRKNAETRKVKEPAGVGKLFWRRYFVTYGEPVTHCV